MQGNPTVNRRTFRDVDRDRNVVARIVVAEEAIEDGDPSAAHVVLVDLEHELREELRGAGPFRWPGLLERHRFDCRPSEHEARRAA